MPRKPSGSQATEGLIPKAAPPGRVLEKCPILASYLTDLAYEEGGGPRVPSRLFISAGGGEWLVTLKDETEARQLRVRVGDLGTAYAALEALLGSPVCPWEPDAYAMQKRTGGRKK